MQFFGILRNNTTLFKFKYMFRQKLLSSSVKSQSTKLNKYILWAKMLINYNNKRKQFLVQLVDGVSWLYLTKLSKITNQKQHTIS